MSYWNFGRVTTTSNSGSAVANNKYGGVFANPTAGEIVKILAYISCDAGGAAPVRYGIYKKSDYSLVGVTEAQTVPAGTAVHWRELYLPAPIAIAAADFILCVHAGSDYLNIYRDLTGGVSGYVWDLYSDGLNNPWGTWSPDTKHYCICAVVQSPNAAPYAPTLTHPTSDETLDPSQQQTFTFASGDPDSGDTLSAHTLRYKKIIDSTWTELAETVSPYASHVIAGGTFVSEFHYEYQIKCKDNHGLEGPYSSSATFYAYTAVAPGTPTITDPPNEHTIATPTHDLTWSITNQDAWQGRRMNDVGGSPGSTVYEDTGTVEEAATRTKTWTFLVNDRTEHLQVRVRHDAIWGDWATVKVFIAFTAPETPLLEIAVFSDTEDTEGGYITLTPTQPTPGEGKPTVVAIDVYRTETDSKDDAIRIAADLDPEAVYEDWEWARYKSYKYFIRAIGDNGATADSDLEG